jgi:hypothetical protein
MVRCRDDIRQSTRCAALLGLPCAMQHDGGVGEGRCTEMGKKSCMLRVQAGSGSKDGEWTGVRTRNEGEGDGDLRDTRRSVCKSLGVCACHSGGMV